MPFSLDVFTELMYQTNDSLVEIDLQVGDMPAPYAGVLDSSISVPLRRLFFEGGLALTPLLTEEDMAPWYMAVRYARWLVQEPGPLWVRPLFLSSRRLDSRYKSLFSEDMGVAFAAVILVKELGAFPPVDIAAVQPAYASGPRADYVAFAMDTDGAIRGIIVESKGSLRQAVSDRRKAKAKEQVENTSLEVDGVDEWARMTFCSAICYEVKNTRRTCCEVKDPPHSSHESVVQLDPVRFWRVAYAKALHFIGFDEDSRRVEGGLEAKLSPLQHTVGGRLNTEQHIRRRVALARGYGAEYILELDEFGVVISSDILGILRAGLTADNMPMLLKTLAGHRATREAPNVRSFMNTLGIGLVHYVDLRED